MNITKYGHCCLLIEQAGTRILTDPGAWSTIPTDLKQIDVILITHEHADHLHVASLQQLLSNNPAAVVITNTAVGKIIAAEAISYQVVEDSQSTTIKGVLIEGFGTEHAAIYPTIPAVQNTGYFIGQQLFYPGDALYDPSKPVEILALPVVGPWLKISEAIDYAKKLKPKVCFPVHDGMLKITGPFHKVPEMVLAAEGIRFVVLTDNQTTLPW